MPDEAHLTHS
uniref:Uncharacterized protein n=1 Tax=Anguilla anguilla TaxID=7936 RepID=A0A0E9PY16_ANGAN